MATNPALFFMPGIHAPACTGLRNHLHCMGEQAMSVCRGVRGATTVAQVDRESVLAATRELLAAMVRANAIEPEEVASVIFTTTPDITSVFPATAARQLGWLDVPLMCGHEMDVEGALSLCIRVMIHWNTETPQADIRHIYLHEARSLRPDKSIVLSEEDIAELNRWIDEHLVTL
jgi:chorismate mutase